MKISLNKVLLIGLILVILKSLIWWTIVPVWQTPDEQSHFAQLQWYAEKKNLNIGEVNLSKEVLVSEELLGTERNSAGNNSYTYHPEYNIPYTESFTGKSEKEINSQSLTSRTEMAATEAAMYPPLFYLAGLPFYNAVYGNGLIDRVFAARLLSVVLNIALVIAAYFVGREIWKKGVLPVVLAGLVAFQPMVSFVGAGIHPDNLLNFLYTAGLLVTLLILKNGMKAKYIALLAILLFLGFETKPLMLLLFPVAAAAAVYKKSRVLAIALLVFPVLLFFIPVSIPFVPRPTGGISLTEYLHFRVGKAFFEIWPWYWGVFKWLGVTLPPVVMKIITRVAVFAGLGLIFYFYRAARAKKKSFETEAIFLFIVSSVSYFVYLALWDWRLMQLHGFSAGLQGRYFFPNIVPHMALLLIGIISLIPDRFKKYRPAIAVICLIAMICFNAIAILRVAESYYDLSSGKVFLTQVSQYKPGIIKSAVQSILKL